MITTLISLSLTYSYLWYQSFIQPSFNTNTVHIIIPKKTHFNDVVQLLAANQLITNPTAFIVITRLKKLTPLIKAGEYIFPAHISAEAVLDMLVKGKTVQHYITFVEGLTSCAIVTSLRAAPYMSGDITVIPEDGTLLPETYAYIYGDERQTIIKRMQKAMEQTLLELWSARQEDLPLATSHQAVILASIVEKETALIHERPLVAAVFINRLRKNMPLQADPTVIYALENQQGEFFTRSLTRSDLRLDHPYNTYKILGLPPGPICNPGRASIKAVLHPADNNNLYFVADGTGGHVFSETLQQHQLHHKQWRKIRDGK